MPAISVFLLTGPSAAGKSTVARQLARGFREAFTSKVTSSDGASSSGGRIRPRSSRPGRESSCCFAIGSRRQRRTRTRTPARGRSGYELWSIEQLYRVFEHETPRYGLWLDTSDQSPEETVDEIVARTAAAE